MTQRGLYVFDWRTYDGPYNLICTPSIPIHVAALGPSARRAANLVHLPGVFADQSTLTIE